MNPIWTAREMTPCEAAWVAGIVDGEGTITIRSKPYPGGYRYQVASISVPNTDTWMIARLVECTGIGRVGMNVRLSHKRKEIWRWQTDQRQAAAVVRQLIPYLTTKHDQALLLLEMQSLRRHGKYRPGARERQLEIVDELHRLNQRGVQVENEP
jgi:hypothetical protein